MPLTPEQLNRFKAMSARANQIVEMSSQGIDFKPRVGSFTVVLDEIAGARDLMWVEYADHSYPDNQGATICARSLGREHCLVCELLEHWQDTQDEYLQRILPDLSVQKTKYAMKVYYQSKETGVWMGPFRWRMREDQYLKFSAYWSGEDKLTKYGLPTVGSYDVTVVARKKQFKGKDVLDIASVIKDQTPVDLKLDVKRIKDIDIVKLCSPRTDEEIMEKLEETSLGPYLRNLDISSIQQDNTPAEAPASTQARVPTSTPTPAPSPAQEAPAASEQEDIGDPPPCFKDEWIEGDETCVTCPFQGPCSDAVKAKTAPPPEVAKPKFMGKSKAVAPAVVVTTPVSAPANPAPAPVPAAPQTASTSNSPLSRARAAMNKGK